MLSRCFAQPSATHHTFLMDPMSQHEAASQGAQAAALPTPMISPRPFLARRSLIPHAAAPCPAKACAAATAVAASFHSAIMASSVRAAGGKLR